MKWDQVGQVGHGISTALLWADSLELKLTVSVLWELSKYFEKLFLDKGPISVVSLMLLKSNFIETIEG